ncbi:hypothetical protein G7Y89_g5340 [Cudoniella acicularis]|uniref:Uncharacterized protein n=1 Tax=Cudoniella acicularis TaxID=354080 RepID=A0A8H4W5T1_9HELO|nr:hypothetical protein G7Y89_g5340 [Cudoniella acicularis]
MGSKHNHAPWRKAVLIPFWILQLLFMLIMIALLGLSIGLLVTWEKDNDSDSDLTYDGLTEDAVEKTVHIIAPVWIGICSACVVLTVVEIILLARHSLKPLRFVIMNSIKTAIWMVLFVLDIISATTKGGRTTSFLGLAIDAILLLCFWIPLIYGSVVYHRTRREQKFYKPVDIPHNPTDLEYPSQYKNFVVEQPVDAPAPGRPRRLSYNHQRDTRFESYRQERNSLSDPSPIERTVGSPVNRSSTIPEVYIEHHDGEAFEMENSKRDFS